MPWSVFADELDVLARQLKRLRFAPIEAAHETRSELVHEFHKLSSRIREAAKRESNVVAGLKTLANLKRANGAQPIKPGRRTVADGRVIEVDFRNRRSKD